MTPTSLCVVAPGKGGVESGPAHHLPFKALIDADQLLPPAFRAGGKILC